MVKKLFKGINAEASQNVPKTEPPGLSELREHIHAKYPIRHLNSRHKKWIEDLSEHAVYDKSDVIFESGENCSHAVYLLQGSISLKADDGKYKIIHHSDESALYPLARVNPRQYTAKALKPNTILLWVDRKLIKSCINTQLRGKKTSKSSDSYLVEILPDAHPDQF
ncbi:MAG: hypothetical protein P8Y20_00215 [Gammaproteobacteria bacterium]|jgi:CRP-like cAMP-binding protein